jgi:hypothetical protein
MRLVENKRLAGLALLPDSALALSILRYLVRHAEGGALQETITITEEDIDAYERGEKAGVKVISFTANIIEGDDDAGV